MKLQFRLFRRGKVFWCQNNATGKQESLNTKNRQEAACLLNHKNEASRKSAINLQIARSYLVASNPKFVTRTWQEVMDAIVGTKEGNTKERWSRAIIDAAFDSIRSLSLHETTADHFLEVMENGTVATNVFLRRIQNYAVGMNWITGPVLAKKQWPAVRHKEKRAITHKEHLRIVERETNSERRAFYELCWHLGGSQSDIAGLRGENFDWPNQCVTYFRQKTKSKVQMKFGADAAEILKDLPKTGAIFPYLATVRACDRATEFKQRCQGLGIVGVTLHSYRYSWAERAMACGYPERYAQLALGHNSKAVHRAYAKKAEVTLPPMDGFQLLKTEAKSMVPEDSLTNAA